MEITSVNNDLVKETVKLQQKKYRTQSGKFLIEGFKGIKEAYEYGIRLETIFVEKSKSENYKFLPNILVETTPAVLKKLSTTDTPPDAIAVGFQKSYDKNILKSMKKVILLEDIKDLGNLGTIIRTAVAFGAEAIVLSGDSVDYYNPKCVRASVGNLWKIPVIEIKSHTELESIFNKFERIATLPRANFELHNYSPKYPLLVMFGSEANGLSDEMIKFATNSVKIEMQDNVESLNLATSVAVVTYKLFN